MEIMLWTMAVGLGVSTTALLTVSAVSLVGAPAVFSRLRTQNGTNTTGRNAGAAAATLSSASIVAGMSKLKEFSGYWKKKQELKEACDKDPFKKAIMMKYEWES